MKKHLSNKVFNVCALIIASIAVTGCTDPDLSKVTSESTAKTTLAKGFEDCIAGWILISETQNAFVMRCPAATTSTTHRVGKQNQVNIVNSDGSTDTHIDEPPIANSDSCSYKIVKYLPNGNIEMAKSCK